MMAVGLTALQNSLWLLFFFILLRHGFDVVAGDVLSQKHKRAKGVGEEQSRLTDIYYYVYNIYIL